MKGRRFIAQNALFGGLIVMMIIFATQSSVFLTTGNLRDVAVQVSILGIVAVTSAILLLAGGVDLSIGATLAMGAVVTGKLITVGWDPVAASLMGVLAGGGIGVVNGFLCAYLRFSPIVVTLGMLTAVRGAAYFVERNPTSGFGDSFGWLGRGTVVGVPVLILIAAGTFIVGGIFLRLMPWGRHVYAIGVNPEAAYLSGVRVRLVPFLLYVATGLSAGLGGVLLASRLNTASPATLGIGFELDVLTAVLLGGVAFGGGRGSLFGVLVGVIFLGILANGLVLMNVFPFVQLLVKGLALVGAAGLDALGTRVDERSRYRRALSRQRAGTGPPGEGGPSPPDLPRPEPSTGMTGGGSGQSSGAGTTPTDKSRGQ